MMPNYNPNKNKTSTRFVAVLLCTAAASLLAFYLFWRYDNKYTRPRPYAENGVVYRNRIASEALPCFFLVDGWALYRDELLPPERLQGRVPSEHIYIGQYSGFDFGVTGRPPHGSATYRITVLLDEAPSEYALELTQIYSKWRLWVNGELLQCVGLPLPDGASMPRPVNGIAVFKAAGSAEIVVEAEGEGSFYGGMIYPPAFGTPQAVGELITRRLFAHTAAVFAAFLLGLSCAAMALFYKNGRPYAGFAVLCAAFAGATGYPVANAVGFLPGGWNTLEQICYYLMFTAVIYIQGRLFSLPRGWYRTACGVSALPCAGIAVLPLLPASGALLYGAFSQLLTWHKWAVALYLIIIGIRLVRRGAGHSKPFLLGFEVYACALCSDRLHPLHEPALLGWNAEIGAAVTICVIAFVLWRDALDTWRERQALTARMELADYQLAARNAHAQTQQEYVRLTRRQLHETRNRLIVMRHYLQEGETEKAAEYLDSLLRSESRAPAVYTGHPLLDAILFIQFSRAREENIYLEHRFEGDFKDLPITDTDLTALLMNLLDNACEACRRISEDGRRWIALYIKAAPGIMLELECSNSAPQDGASPGTFKPGTTKHDAYAHGFGLAVIEETASHYGGSMEIKRLEDSFALKINMVYEKAYASSM
jgi:hypothetical protein